MLSLPTPPVCYHHALRYNDIDKVHYVTLIILKGMMITLLRFFFFHISLLSTFAFSSVLIIYNFFLLIFYHPNSVAFRTTPFDNTGVSHILEHTVLCGSDKYPIRDPFFKMLNRSLSTFMNAMTGQFFNSYDH